MAINSPITGSVDIEQLAQAVDQAIDYLQSKQLPSGEFRSYLVPKPITGVPPQPDSSPFPAALIAHCLRFVQSPKAAEMVRKAAQFLLAEMQPGGLWRYFSSRHPRHDESPLDLDDTACASALLRDTNTLVPDNVDVLLSNRNKQGLFHTWLIPRTSSFANWRALGVAIRQLRHPLKLRSFFRLNEAEPEDVDAVVNASALYWLGASKATEPVVAFLSRVIKERTEETSDKWHHSRFNLYYFLSKSVYADINPFSDVRDDIIHRIEAASREGGLIGNHILDTALALSALFNLSHHSAVTERAIAFLLAHQNTSGAWPAVPLYYGGPSQGCSFSSEELTTAFCAEALARFQRRVDGNLRAHKTDMSSLFSKSALTATGKRHSGRTDTTCRIKPITRARADVDHKYPQAHAALDDAAMPQHLLTMLQYTEFSAAALGKQAGRYRNSKSWKLTSCLRGVNAGTKRLQRTVRSFFGRAGHVQSPVVQQAIKAVQRSALFDERYYAEQLEARQIVVEDALSHFILHGWRQGLNPNFFFDCSFYCEQAKRGGMTVTVNPLLHYIIEGTHRKIQTSKFFDPQWYIDAYADVLDSGIDPLAHFIQFGLVERRVPVPMMMHKFQTSIPASAGRFRRKSAATAKVPYDFVVCFHQASRTGAPMLGLKIVEMLSERNLNCLVVLLAGGDLQPRLQDLSDTIDLSGAAYPEYGLEAELARLNEDGLLGCQPTVIANSMEVAALLPAFKRHGLPVLSLIHEFTASYAADIQALVLEHSDSLVFSSEATLKNAAWLAGSNKTPHVIPQGLLEPEFGSMSKARGREFLKQELGIETGAYVVLACATLEPRKGTDFFIQAARQVLSLSEPAADIHFIWVGGEHRGSMEALRWAKVDAHQAGIYGRVHFVGHKQDVEPFFAGADLFLLPSRQDPLPCVLHLAMASGLPTVAFYNSGGAQEVLADGGGKLVDYGDAAAMARAIEEYRRDRTALRFDGERAREIVHSKYKMTDYLGALLSLSQSTRRDCT